VQLLEGRGLRGEDLKLARLIRESRKLGVTGIPSFPPGARSTKLDMDYGNDELPIPTLEPGSSTPNLPFPSPSNAWQRRRRSLISNMLTMDYGDDELPIPTLEPGSSTPNLPFPSPSNAWQRRRRSLISNMLTMDYGDDELPIPNLEPGSSTPNIPFPPGSGVADKAGRMQSLAQEVDNSGEALDRAGVKVGADLSSVNSHEDDRYVGAQHVAPSVAFKGKLKKTQSLYAPAWSPDYLEPYRHPSSEQSAWQWMSKAKKQHKNDLAVEDKEAADAQKSLDEIVSDVWNKKIEGQGIVGAQTKAKHEKAAATVPETSKSVATKELGKPVAAAQKVAQATGSASNSVNPRSHAASGRPERTQKLVSSSVPTKQFASSGKKGAAQETSDKPQMELEKLELAEDILHHKTQAKANNVLHASAVAKPDVAASVTKGEHQVSSAKKESHQQALFAHGFGTTNRFQAQPLSASKNQDRHVYGSDAEAGDVGHPTSFDSIPLASPSTFMSRVAAYEPSGVSSEERVRLDREVYRGQVLAAWRKYEHGLQQCMEAESTIDPTLKDYSCKDVSKGFKYLRDCMQNHNFGLQDVGGVKLKFVGDEKAWSALPKLVQYTYTLPTKDYEKVYNVLSQSAIFGTLWNMERLHARCAATGSTEAPGPSRAAVISSIDRDVRGYDEAMRRLMPGTPTQQRGYDIMHNGYNGMVWHYPGVARGVSRGYWKIPSSSREVAPSASRASLPYWREVAGNQPTLGGLRRVQPRARLNPDTAGPAAFPTRVNGKRVHPANPRPWQASKGAPDPWTGYYWTGPGKFDIVPESHPVTQAISGYNYPTTAKPAAGLLCVEDVECPQMSVCSSAGFCRAWGGDDVWHVPAQHGLWPANSSPDWF